MLMLMAPENNSDASQPIVQGNSSTNPTVPPTGVSPPEIIQPQVIVPDSPIPQAQPNLGNPVMSSPPTPLPEQPTPSSPPITPQVSMPASPVPPAVPPVTKPGLLKKILGHKKLIAMLCLILLFGGAVAGAYFFGKSHEKIIIQAPPPQPISLPPQAVIVTNCQPGRGKQYILPKDIPFGPVYDVVNNKVIAVEYNFKASDLFVNGNRLSDTLIPFFKGNYKTEFFVITPGALQAGQSQADTPVNVAIFVVSKDDVNKISCEGTP